MAVKLVAVGVAAAAVLVAASLVNTADAHRGGGGGGGGGGSGGSYRSGGGGSSNSMARSYRSGGSGYTPRSHSYQGSKYQGGKAYSYKGGKVHTVHRGRHRFHRRFIVGAPYDYYDYAYGDGCEWLRQRALYSGSSYWWNRYNACLESYGYY